MIPLQPFPDVNSDFALINIEMVPGTTLAQTEKTADVVAEMVSKRTEVDHALALDPLRAAIVNQADADLSPEEREAVAAYREELRGNGWTEDADGNLWSPERYD